MSTGVEMKEFVDLPAEVICIIASFVDVKTVNNLRLVCLSNQHLYNNVYPDLTRDVKKRAILRITEEKCEQLDFNKHYNCIIKSEFEIGIKIPDRNVCFAGNVSLYSLLINLVKNQHARVNQLQLATENETANNGAKDLLKDMLPHLNHLQKMKIFDGANIFLACCSEYFLSSFHLFP